MKANRLASSDVLLRASHTAAAPALFMFALLSGAAGLDGAHGAGIHVMNEQSTPGAPITSSTIRGVDASNAPHAIPAHVSPGEIVQGDPSTAPLPIHSEMSPSATVENPPNTTALNCPSAILQNDPSANVWKGPSAIVQNDSIAIAQNDPNSVIQSNPLIFSEELETHRCGNLAHDETWGPAWGTYVLDCTVVVPVGVTLTILPGTAVLGETSTCGLEVDGTLKAGAEGGPYVRFSSGRDRRVPGHPRDESNLPAPGDWKGIGFAASSRDNVLNNVEIYFAGAGFWFAEGASASIVSTTRFLTIRNTGIAAGSAAAVYLTGPASLGVSIRKTVAASNALNGILVPEGDLTADLPGYGTWEGSLPYVLGGIVVVPEGLTLTIQPGTVVKGGAGTSGLEVRGSLHANGNEGSIITFTSQHDDAGNDTDAHPTEPAPGDWKGIGFNASSAKNLLKHVEVRYGGGARWFVDGDNANITSDTASLTIRNSQILDGSAAAVFLSGPASLGASIHATAASGNAFNGLLVPGGNLTAALPAIGTWSASLPYVLGGVVVVPKGLTLNLKPATVVKGGAGSRGLEVRGTLLANAAGGPAITFTSLWDDALHGTAASPSAPAPGDWKGIGFNASSTGSVLNNVDVRYGGGATWFSAGDRANVTSDSPSLIIRNCQVRDGLAAAIFLSGPASLGDSIQSTIASGNGINGLVVAGGDLTHAPTPLMGTWNASLPYVLAGTVVVPGGVTLKLLPGTVVKGGASTYGLEVRGTLNADAAGGPPIYFTSLHDDLINDTDGHPIDPLPGSWKGIAFNASSSANILNNVEVRYGGGAPWYAGDDAANIMSESPSLAISNSVVCGSSAAGLHVAGSGVSPSIVGTRFLDNHTDISPAK